MTAAASRPAAPCRVRSAEYPVIARFHSCARGFDAAARAWPVARACGTLVDMGPRRSVALLRQSWQSSHALLLLPIAFIVVITVVDIHSPEDVHLGPALVIAPALT